MTKNIGMDGMNSMKLPMIVTRKTVISECTGRKTIESGKLDYIDATFLRGNICITSRPSTWVDISNRPLEL